LAAGFQWQLFAIRLVAGTFEEMGWTGFATPAAAVAASLRWADARAGVGAVAFVGRNLPEPWCYGWRVVAQCSMLSLATLTAYPFARARIRHG